MFYFYQMKKLLLVGSLLASISFFAQTFSKNKNLFKEEDSSLASFSFVKETALNVQFQKFYNSPVPFSIYNPKPGFTPTKIESQKYYSFVNTKLLLKREMSNIDPEPIFPDQSEKKTFGEAIFHDVLDGLFNKK